MDKVKSMLDFTDRASYVQYLEEQCLQLRRNGDTRSADMNEAVVKALRDYEFIIATIPTVALLCVIQVELVFGRKHITCEEHHVLEQCVDSTRDAIFFAACQHLYEQHLTEMLEETDMKTEPWEHILDLMPTEMRRVMRVLRQREEARRG